MTLAHSIDSGSLLSHSHSWMERDPFYAEKLPALLGPHFAYDGEYTTAFFAYPKDFHPFNNDAFVSSLWELCTGSIGQLKTGYYETICPALAESMVEEVIENEIIYHVTLHPKICWEELDLKAFQFTDYLKEHFSRKPLTSYDFKLFVDAFQNPYVRLPKAASLKKRYQNLKEIRVLDDRHFDVIWNKGDHSDYEIPFLTAQLRPIPCHVFLYSLKGEPLFNQITTNSYEFAKQFTNHWAKSLIISCGPWVIHSKSPNQIVLLRNKNFYNPYAALMQKMIFNYKSSSISAWQAFKANELTSCYLSPMQLEDGQAYIAQNEDVKIIEYFSKMYYFIGWNQHHPLFDSPKVRRALSMAINRDQLIHHFLKDKAQKLSGPFIPHSPAYNDQVAVDAYDPQQAMQLLEEEGWHQQLMHQPREKIVDGKHLAFRFHLAYFLQSELSEMICQYVASCLKAIGVDCQLQGLNYSEFMQRYENKTFDALYMGWSLSPPPIDLAPTWHSKEAEKVGSSNIIGFHDDQVDQYLEQLRGLRNPQERLSCYHKIHERIHELSPYAFLFVPKQVFVYRKQLSNVWLPKQETALFDHADIEELCPKVFYFSQEKL